MITTIDSVPKGWIWSSRSNYAAGRLDFISRNYDVAPTDILSVEYNTDHRKWEYWSSKQQKWILFDAGHCETINEICAVVIALNAVEE